MAVFGIIGSCWGYIKSFTSRISSFVIVRVQVNDSIAQAVSLYCWKELKRSPFGLRVFEAINIYVQPRQRSSLVVIENISPEPIIFWKGWRPLFFGGTGGSDSGSTKNTGNSSSGSSITFIRGTFNIDELLFRVCEKYNDAWGNVSQNEEVDIKRFFIRHIFGSLGEDSRAESPEAENVLEASGYEKQIKVGSLKIIGYNPEDIGYKSKTKDPYITYLAFPDHVNKLIDEIVHWKMSEEWYTERAIPWKRGWLLYGTPGTGKTSLVRAIAEHLDLPLYVFDLTTMNNENLIYEWKRMLRSTPCIALFEDLDNVFEGRKNINKNSYKQVLSFDCLLNVMDGVEKSDGVFTVITTNQIDRLDKAIGIPQENGRTNGTGISTRPGRIDKVLELGLIDKKCRQKLAERILKEWPVARPEIIEKGEGDTPAQFQERCSQLALKLYWEQKEKEKNDNIEKPKYTKSELEMLDRYGSIVDIFKNQLSEEELLSIKELNPKLLNNFYNMLIDKRETK